MKKGYYTDSQGNCLGGWELNEKPQDTDSHKWFESDVVPPVWIDPIELKKRDIQEKKAQRAQLEQDIAYSQLTGDMYDETISWADKKKAEWIKLRNEIRQLGGK